VVLTLQQRWLKLGIPLHQVWLKLGFFWSTQRPASLPASATGHTRSVSVLCGYQTAPSLHMTAASPTSATRHASSGIAFPTKHAISTHSSSAVAGTSLPGTPTPPRRDGLAPFWSPGFHSQLRSLHPLPQGSLPQGSLRLPVPVRMPVRRNDATTLDKFVHLLHVIYCSSIIYKWVDLSSGLTSALLTGTL
jgi:hypothetical protein